ERLVMRELRRYVLAGVAKAVAAQQLNQLVGRDAVAIVLEGYAHPEPECPDVLCGVELFRRDRCHQLWHAGAHRLGAGRHTAGIDDGRAAPQQAVQWNVADVQRPMRQARGHQAGVRSEQDSARPQGFACGERFLEEAWRERRSGTGTKNNGWSSRIEEGLHSSSRNRHEWLIDGDETGEGELRRPMRCASTEPFGEQRQFLPRGLDLRTG